MAPAAVPRRTRTRRAAIPVLPEELVLWEILVRLPAKALLRCRAVCRSWRRLTSAADFLLVHHRHQPSLPLVSFRGQIHASSDVVDAAIDAFDIQGAPVAAERRPVLRFNDYNQRRNFKVHGSCDGLLLFSLSNNRFYICNPATRQWIALPRLTGAHVAGLYKHSSSGEYCILFWKGRRQVDVVYFVLTVGSSVEPRCIGQPVASPSIKQCIAAGIMYSSEYPRALLSSCLHWVGLSLKTGLIVFDTVAETFRFIHSPATYNRADDHLLEMNGRLGISRMNYCRTTVELWVLQDYEAEVWSLKYRIKLPAVEMRNIANHSFSGIVVPDKGDVLLHSFRTWHMFHCDSKGKLQQEFLWDRVFPRPIGHWFKESLVKHVFFQKQRLLSCETATFLPWSLV